MSIIERAARRLAERRRESMKPETGQATQKVDELPAVSGRKPTTPFDDLGPDESAPPPMSHPIAADAVSRAESASTGIPADELKTGPSTLNTDKGGDEYEESPFSSAFAVDEAAAQARQTDAESRDDKVSSGGLFANWRPNPEHESPAGSDEPRPWSDIGPRGTALRGDAWAAPDSPVNTENTIRLTEIDQNLLLSPEADKTRTAEEFRIIKRPLLVRAFDRTIPRERHSNLIMVTSSLQSEGKTFISANLAISIAMEMDSTVLLVDADVAKPGLSKMLEISNRPGLIETLTDEYGDLSQLLMRTDIPKLTVLPAGRRHKRSTELLSSIKMRDLLNEMGSRYSDRIVLFDSPPLLESTEAFVLASQMGQVVLVVESDTTSQMMVKESLSHFGNTDNVSIILNKCKDNVFTNLMSGKYSGYGYGYGYGAEPEK